MRAHVCCIHKLDDDVDCNPHFGPVQTVFDLLLLLSAHTQNACVEVDEQWKIGTLPHRWTGHWSSVW